MNKSKKRSDFPDYYNEVIVLIFLRQLQTKNSRS